MVKVCLYCGVAQSWLSFHKDAAKPDGLYPYCKTCRLGVIHSRLPRRTRLTRFWARVRKTDGCWLWAAKCNTRGYGTWHSDKMYLAHRVSWEILNGPVPSKLCVLHACDNPPCVRPDHLFLGTPQDNAIDMARKERGTAKLSWTQVSDIRHRYANGENQYALAAAFGVSQSTISTVIRNKSRTYSPRVLAA